MGAETPLEIESLTEQLKHFAQLVAVLRHETYEQCEALLGSLKEAGIDLAVDTAPEGALVSIKTDEPERAPWGIVTAAKTNVNTPTLALVEASIVQRRVTIERTVARMRDMVSAIHSVALIRPNLSHSLVLHDGYYKPDPNGYENLMVWLEANRVPHIDISNLEPTDMIAMALATVQAGQ